jgi:3-hydroxybutyryl-CoA dehydrogenase
MQTKLEDIKNILILGAGTMGMRIGLQAAISGYNTVIYDISEKSFSYAQKTQQGILAFLEKNQKLTAEQGQDALKRIRFTTDADDAGRDADLVSESVFEDLAIKKEVWAKFGKICPPKTIFTTNTSYLMPSWFAADTGRPELFCAFHFHDVFEAIVVDVMPHAGTEPQVVDLLMELGAKLDQVPVLVNKESPGYIFNAMLVALIGAAGDLVTSGVASFQDVDKSWINNFHMRVGPFGILDNIGLDTAWHVTKSMPDAKSKRFAEFLKTYVDAGKLGVKTKQGFYTY